MPVLVTPPGDSLEDLGYYLNPPFDVIVVALDEEGKAYDQVSGQYLKLSPTLMTSMLYPAGSDIWLSLGAPDGEYVGVGQCSEGDLHLVQWEE